MSRGVRHEGSLCCWVQKYARRRLPKPAKDYLEHILEGWSDALRSYEKRRRTRMSEGKNSSVFMNAPTRRQLIAGMVVAFGGVTLGSSKARARAEEEISRSAEAIHQEPVFKASRKRVYEALTDARQFEKIVQLSEAMKSGMAPGAKPAEISREAGGAVSLFGGHVTGRELEMEPHELNVQPCRARGRESGDCPIARLERGGEGRR